MKNSQRDTVSLQIAFSLKVLILDCTRLHLLTRTRQRWKKSGLLLFSSPGGNSKAPREYFGMTNCKERAGTAATAFGVRVLKNDLITDFIVLQFGFFYQVQGYPYRHIISSFTIYATVVQTVWHSDNVEGSIIPSFQNSVNMYILKKKRKEKKKSVLNYHTLFEGTLDDVG